ncbi:tRNA dimethylallyltransferase [Formosa sp. Hel1_31_208]|uniref:tRNA (adenosine(37)-N6)-dimethylallyltransferase MiaA n=1 Tax=Formosa sp. Hel1_31_208 TaxID=1798225 RepID=UPI00087BEDB3|nr:tRNA (adenosine(37)-N6)-dimethylallyltransferase MiaA [Formosa sp. Hel1_31_208]SDS53181.1 tRNA dimethylallyltransferase [Formosa sp. Hel1_31_208]
MAPNSALNAVANYIMTKVLLSVVGPTAIGKTALSIQLAQHFKTEIISADSRQFYKELQIGTAAPTPIELSSAPHHFIKHISVETHYNVGAFENDAINVLTELFKTNNVVVMVGGSGLYVKVVTHGLDQFPEVDPSIREALNERFQVKGLQRLQEQLKELDPLSYQTIAIDNPHRVIRALEICIASGHPYSSFLDNNIATRDFKTLTIGLTAERSIIYDRINRRVDQMMTEGLLNEVKSLKSKQHLNALNTVGYKELFNYLDGEWDLEFAVSEIKKNTRRFAKRQLTWFKKNDSTLWFNWDTKISDIIARIERDIKTS